MPWILAVVATAVLAIIFVLTMFIADEVIYPMYQVVLNRQAVQEAGFDVGLQTVFEMGTGLVIPLMALAVTLWLLVLRLRKDRYQGVRRR